MSPGRGPVLLHPALLRRDCPGVCRHARIIGGMTKLAVVSPASGEGSYARSPGTAVRKRQRSIFLKPPGHPPHRISLTMKTSTPDNRTRLCFKKQGGAPKKRPAGQAVAVDWRERAGACGWGACFLSNVLFLWVIVCCQLRRRWASHQTSRAQ